jgi:hypothetical protein
MRRERAFSVLLLLLFAACGDDEPGPSPDSGGLVGSLEVKWRIQGMDGSPRTCSEVGVDQMEVSIGAQPRLVACADQMTVFEDLLPDRYPVVLKARSGEAVRASQMSNAVVSAGMRASTEIVFDLESLESSAGSIRVRWLIDGRDAGTQCGLVGGARVEVRTLIGSTGSFTDEAPCAAREIVREMVRVGVYELALRLLDANGAVIASSVIAPFAVEENRLTDLPAVSFSTMGVPKTRIVGLWTVNSSAAADACGLVDGSDVIMTAVPRPPGQVTSSTTSTCTRGRAVIEEGIGEAIYTVRFQLQFGAASVTSTSARVEVARGRTSTVVVDFRTD